MARAYVQNRRLCAMGGLATWSQIDAVIIGAGFSGRARALSAARPRQARRRAGGLRRHRRRLASQRLSGRALRRRELRLFLQFLAELEQEWRWSERYATQPEILTLHQPRRRPLRPAQRHSAEHPRCRRRSMTNRPRAGRSRPRTAANGPRIISGALRRAAFDHQTPELIRGNRTSAARSSTAANGRSTRSSSPANASLS